MEHSMTHVSAGDWFLTAQINFSFSVIFDKFVTSYFVELVTPSRYIFSRFF